MSVLWVLFLVLLNSIGNQGNPNQTAQEEPLPYIVSMRNNDNCHVCTGSIISREWILSYLYCDDASHFLYGLTEYENCTGMQVLCFRGTAVSYVVPDVCQLYKVDDPFKVTVEQFKHLNLPPSNIRLPQTGELIGWSFDNSKSKFVMKTIADLNVRGAFTGNNKRFIHTLCEVGTGSPLIYNNSIYGILACGPYSFKNILSFVILIHEAIKQHT